MKLFSWIHDLQSPSIEAEDESPQGEPPLSPVLQRRMEELERVTVVSVMTPRVLVNALDAEVQLRRVKRLKSAKVAYFPVFRGDLDHILGWISKAKVLELLSDTSDDSKLSAHTKPVGEIPEDASVADLADAFLKSASPFLVVKDKVGATTGIMPLSDFVELIFGFQLSPLSTTSPQDLQTLLASGYEL